MLFIGPPFASSKARMMTCLNHVENVIQVADEMQKFRKTVFSMLAGFTP